MIEGHDSFMCVTSLIYMCDMAHWYPTEDPSPVHRAPEGLYSMYPPAPLGAPNVYSALQVFTVCCSVLQHVAVQRVAACCSVLQRVAACCSAVAAACCLAECCSVLQCVAV